MHCANPGHFLTWGPLIVSSQDACQTDIRRGCTCRSLATCMVSHPVSTIKGSSRASGCNAMRSTDIALKLAGVFSHNKNWSKNCDDLLREFFLIRLQQSKGMKIPWSIAAVRPCVDDCSHSGCATGRLGDPPELLNP